MNELSNAQRALWTFLFYTLVGPFIAALMLVLLMLIAASAGLAPGPEGVAPAGVISRAGEVGLFTYVWAALPAGLAVLGLLPFVFRSGTFGWIPAAIAGVLAFAVAAVLFPVPLPDLMSPLAFFAGIVSMVCRWVLERIGVLAG